MAPEEAKSQPLVMVNVYTRGVLSGKVRVGYAMRQLENFKKYEPGSPGRPRYIPLEPMPFNMHARIPGSVLMVIEHFTTDDVPRHNRRTVKPMVYIVRAYVFMARNIKVDTAGANLALRVACAGISKTTEPEFGQVRPMWMKPLELRVTLCSDHPKEPPTMEPITVTLLDSRTVLGVKADRDIGKTVCTYEYMRQKDNMGRWEPFRLKPQWVQLFGGNYGSVAMGEVLIGFELLHSKFRADLPAIQMWPVSEEEFNATKHFSKLKKATLHFSLYGLRDLIPMGGRSEEPLVNVRVKKFERPEGEEGAKRSKYYSMNFKYEKLVEEGQEDNKDDHLHKWKTDALGQQGCRNFEFFQVQKVNVMLPDKEILQPFIAIRVLEKPMELFHGTALHLKPFGNEGTLVGESRQSLNLLYPCTWYEGITDRQPYSYQENRIKRGVDRASRACASRTLYQEESAEERAKGLQAEKETRRQQQLEYMKSLISMEEEKAEKIDSRAMPLELRPYRATYNPNGYLPEVKEPLRVREEHALNMERLSSFGKRFGERSNKDSDGSTGLRLRGKLEHSKQVHVFQPDFWYHNAPLMRNADIVDLSDETAPDWNFMHDKVFGFVKCVFKLMDGWEDLPYGEDDQEQKPAEESDDEDEPVAVKDVEPVIAQSPVDTGAGVGLLDDAAAVANVRADARKRSKADDTQSVVVTDEDIAKLRRSVGFDDDLDSYAFDVAKLTSRFKNKERVPSRIRVRIYFVKAICIFGKQVEGFFGKAFIDPYLAYKLGNSIVVSMRNMAQYNTNVPSFYRVEERDIVMPAESRLQVDLFDFQDTLGEAINGEKLIGSTVIDLEDRWHSAAWKDCMDRRQQVPTENRGLINPQLSGQNCGSIEMWVEMIDSVRASDIKASELRKPPAMEIEIRLVIRTCKNVKLWDGSKTDVKVTVDLECKEYEGVTMGFPKLQPTDVHLGSTGNAIFNWRIVYPRIVMPTKSCTMDLKLYQANFVSADEFIGAVSVDLRRYVERVARDMDMIYIEKADLQFTAGAAGEGEEGGDGADAAEEETVGSVQFEMWFMTQSEANQKRNGKGREDPNDFPQLVTPAEGRGWGDVLGGFSLSLPDLGLMKKDWIAYESGNNGDQSQVQSTSKEVVQEYISRPLLLDGRKWDLRLYALVVPGYDGGLRCWLARDGLVRVCTDPYREPDATNLRCQTAHLTNYSLNKRSEKFVRNEDPGNGRHGCKRTFSAVLAGLQADGALEVSTAEIWSSLEELASETIRAMASPLRRLAQDPATWEGSQEVTRAASQKFDQCFHILGLDVLLDSSCKPWLLEVNCNPSFSLDEIHALQEKDKGALPTLSTREIGYPCACSAHPQVHMHKVSPVDLAVKLPVLQGAVSIIGDLAMGREDPTEGLSKLSTIYVPI
ncbi:Ttll11 [Symbiodinium sp. CCMP2592]|nr:Ttll11 [Symbiodinium sp. CCMP2592]